VRRSLILLAGLALSACTGQAYVPPVSVIVPDEQRVRGSYAATVQSGGWALRTKSPGHICGGWTFNTDVNPSYERAMQDALTQAFERVSFTSEILSPEQLQAQGYDAQIIIHQGNGESRFILLPQLFSSAAQGDVALTVIVAIRDSSGIVSQDTVIGRGSGRKTVYACPPIGEAIGSGAQGAVRTLVTDVVHKLQDALRKRPVAVMPMVSR
jgi:hypothetical protein